MRPDQQQYRDRLAKAFFDHLRNLTSVLDEVQTYWGDVTWPLQSNNLEGWPDCMVRVHWNRSMPSRDGTHPSLTWMLQNIEFAVSLHWPLADQLRFNETLLKRTYRYHRTRVILHVVIVASRRRG